MTEARPRVMILADGSNALGMGHVYRSLNLADALSTWADVHFLTRGDDVATVKMSERYPTVRVFNQQAEYSVLAETHITTIIVDRLDTETTYMGRLKDLCELLVSFDDCGGGVYESDLAFNVLYHCSLKPGKNTTFYTDPCYAIINPRFSTEKKRENRVVPMVLVTLGGADTLGLTPSVIRALDSMSEIFEMTAVIGPTFNHHKELEETMRGCRRRIDVRHNVTKMWEVMADSDIAISAGGNTLFELAATGTPAIVLCEELFEVETADRLEAYGTCVNLGYAKIFDHTKLIRLVREFLEDSERRERMGKAGRKLVDGRGAERASQIIRTHAK